MNRYLKLNFALVLLAIFVSGTVLAETEEKMIIALKTDHFELAETDISTLAVGEAKTIETESGKVIDIIRTADGAEIYVDGERLEMDFDHEGLHEEHMIRKHIEIICDEGEDCDKHTVIHAEGDTDISEWMVEGGDHVIIRKEIELSCTDDESGTSCSDSKVWVTDDEDIDIEALHGMHTNGEARKVIVIKKQIDSEN
jgi:hypothetical protein